MSLSEGERQYRVEREVEKALARYGNPAEAAQRVRTAIALTPWTSDEDGEDMRAVLAHLEAQT